MQQDASVRDGLPGKTAAQFRQGSLIRQLWETNREVFQRDKLALFGLVIFVIFTIVAILAPQIAPNDPLTPLKNKDGDWIKDATPYWLAEAGEDEAEGYSNTFLLGTTNIGRDIFSQLIHGSRSALLVGFSAAAAVAVIGTVVGLMAGYYGGRVDAVLMRAADVAFGIPFIPFIIVIAAFFDPNIWNVVYCHGASCFGAIPAGLSARRCWSSKSKPFVSAARVSLAPATYALSSFISRRAFCPFPSSMALSPSLGPS